MSGSSRSTQDAWQAPWWLPGGNLQTLFPALCARRPAVHYTRERWLTPDSDFIDLDWVNVHKLADKTASHLPLVVLFHGLEGNSDSHYARALMHAVAARGWLGVVPHFRGCSGTINLAPRFYHSGDATEVGWILQRLHAIHCATQSGNRPLYVAGVSLGGNALLRFLGEHSHSAHFIQAAAAISAPLDLTAGGAALSQGFNMVYTRNFLATLKRKCLAKLAQYPGLFDRHAMLASRDLYAFDNIVTAPLHGYRDTDDYWLRASSKPILPEIAVRTLVLNAQNDPFLPAHFLPHPHQISSAVHLEQPCEGGHVGFVRASTADMPLLSSLPERILRFFDTAS